MKLAIVAIIIALALVSVALANGKSRGETIFERIVNGKCHGRSPCACDHGGCCDGECYPSEEGLGECGPDAFEAACVNCNNDDIREIRAISHFYQYWAAGDLVSPPNPPVSSAAIAVIAIGTKLGSTNVTAGAIDGAFNAGCPPLPLDKVSKWLKKDLPNSAFGEFLGAYEHIQGVPDFVEANGDIVDDLSPKLEQRDPENLIRFPNPARGCVEGACSYTISGVTRRLPGLADRLLCEGDPDDGFTQVSAKVNEILCLSLINDDWEYKQLLTSVFTCRSNFDGTCTYFFRGARTTSITQAKIIAP